MSAVFENEHYIVVAAHKGGAVGDPDKDEYRVANKAYSIVEFSDPQIANAIQYAEHAHWYLKHRLWRAVEVQAQGSAEFLDQKQVVSALDTVL